MTAQRCLGSATANGSGAWSFTTAALTNGAHSLTATATDVAGNTGVASGALSVTIDTTAPATPTIASFSIDSGTVGDGITNDQTLTLTGAAEANSTVKVYDGATLLGSASANGSGAWSFITAALADGAHSFTATATDAAGNTSAATTTTTSSSIITSALTTSTTATVLNVTIDGTAPVAPSIGSDVIVNTNEVALTGTAEANTTVKIYDGATLLGSVLADGSGAWAYTTAGLSNGTHNLIATATDAAGNTGATSTAVSVTMNTPIPATPVISSFSTDSGALGDHITNDSTLTLTGTADANATVKVYDGAALLGSVLADGSGAWIYTTAALADGTHSLTATDTVAGITGAPSTALSVAIDTTAPVSPIIASFSTDSGALGDHITNDNTPTLTGTAEANSTIKIYDGATVLGSVMADGTGAWSFTSAPLTDGNHNLTANSTDVAGNTGVASTALNLIVDTTTPTAPSFGFFSPDTGTIGDGITGANDLMLTGTAEANSTVKIYDGATLLGSAAVNGSGVWSLDSGVLANGSHSFTATTTDAAGNLSSGSSALNVTVDTSLAVPSVTENSFALSIRGVGLLTGTAPGGAVSIYDGSSGAYFGPGDERLDGLMVDADGDKLRRAHVCCYQ